MWKYGRHAICGGEIGEEKKKDRKKKNKRHDENIMVCPIPQGDHNYPPNMSGCLLMERPLLKLFWAKYRRNRAPKWRFWGRKWDRDANVKFWFCGPEMHILARNCVF